MVAPMTSSALAARVCAFVWLAVISGCAVSPPARPGGGGAAAAPEAHERHRQVRFLLGNAEGYFFSGRYAEAIPGYTAVLALDPANAVAFRCRAAALAALGRESEALADYAKAIAIDARYDEARLGRGLYYFSKNRFAEAIDDFDAAIAIDANNAGAHFFKALACEKVGRLREAAAARQAYIHCVVPRDGGQPGEPEVGAREVKALGLRLEGRLQQGNKGGH